MGISRRTIMKYGLGGAVVLTIGGTGLALRSTVPVAPHRPLSALSDREFSILAAVTETILPGGDGFPTAREVEVAERVDEALAACHVGIQKEFRQVLGLLESALAGFLLGGRISTFSSLPPEGRAEVLDSWRTARISLFRTAFKALHGLIAASYYSTEMVHARIGYPGVPSWVTEIRLRGTE